MESSRPDGLVYRNPDVYSPDLLKKGSPMSNFKRIWDTPEVVEALEKIQGSLATTQARHATAACALYLATIYEAAERLGEVSPDGMEKFLNLTKALHEELKGCPTQGTTLH